MRNAVETLMVATVAVSLIGCGNGSEDVDDGTNIAEINGSVVEVETLPPDESVATPTADLANGAVDAPEDNTSY